MFPSPNPSVTSPPPTNVTRMPSGSYQPIWQDGQPDPQRSLNSRRPPPNLGLAPGLPFSSADAYDGTSSSSPASVVFPHRARSAAQPNRPNFASSSTASTSSRSFSNATSPSIVRTDSVKFPSAEIADELSRTVSPPPDYLRAMGNLNFDGSGSIDLSDLSGPPARPPRSPKRESRNVFESLMSYDDVPGGSLLLSVESGSLRRSMQVKAVALHVVQRKKFLAFFHSVNHHIIDIPPIRQSQVAHIPRWVVLGQT